MKSWNASRLIGGGQAKKATIFLHSRNYWTWKITIVFATQPQKSWLLGKLIKAKVNGQRVKHGLKKKKINCVLTSKQALFWLTQLCFNVLFGSTNTLRWTALTSSNEQLKKWEPESIRVHLICVEGKLLAGGNQIHIWVAWKVFICSTMRRVVETRRVKKNDLTIKKICLRLIRYKWECSC